ncbi:MAG: hypothetical protein RXS42_04050 [Nitrososphaeria archaeon]
MSKTVYSSMGRRWRAGSGSSSRFSMGLLGLVSLGPGRASPSTDSASLAPDMASTSSAIVRSPSPIAT